MSNDPVLVARKEVITPRGKFTLELTREDLTGTYPGMYRYCLAARYGPRMTRAFRTNTYEYSPGCPLDAESVSIRRLDEWEKEINESPGDFLESGVESLREVPLVPPSDVLVIQGSPRGDGNCSIIAKMVAGYANDLGKSVRVIYPDDMGIHPCIGCYQCYNSGSCTFTDDMDEVIQAIRGAQLVVLCSPVYTNTVPGSLKVLIDRCLTIHASATIGHGAESRKGILVAVAGRKGESNFRCITAVVHAFMENTGITCIGDLLLDEMDYRHDVRDIPGLQELLSGKIREAFR